MNRRLKQHIRQLSQHFPVRYDDIEGAVTVCNVPLKPGFNRDFIDIKIYIPYDYPLSPPGVAGAGVYLDKSLRYLGRKIRDFHLDIGPCQDRDLAWFCYEKIDWSPNHDDLQTLLAKIRHDISDAADAVVPHGAQHPSGGRGFLDRLSDFFNQ